MKLLFTLLCGLCATTVLVLNLLGLTHPWSAGTNFSVTPMHNITNKVVKRTTAESEPLILIYNSLYSAYDWSSSWVKVDRSDVVYYLQDCPSKCHFTFEKYFQRFADFVLASLASYKKYGGIIPNFKYSKEGQIWTAFTYESPAHIWGQGYETVDDIFHWIATYRQDSDVFLPYGRFYPVDPADEAANYASVDDIRSSLSQKKLATWLVSNCGGLFKDTAARWSLVQTLKRFIPIDMYGYCSGVPCPETTNLTCRDYLAQKYKFYLAFENSLCLDYVTEKFFLSFEYGMVPVVFGWANYSLYAPAGSYINALDFDSVEDLAKYLLYLDENDEEYLKYFWWRGQYAIENLSMHKRMCILCQNMYEYKMKRKGNESVANGGQIQKYPSVRKWHESLPSDSVQSVPFYIGGKTVFNSAKVCVRHDEHPVLQNWLKGK